MLRTTVDIEILFGISLKYSRFLKMLMQAMRFVLLRPLRSVYFSGGTHAHVDVIIFFFKYVKMSEIN